VNTLDSFARPGLRAGGGRRRVYSLLLFVVASCVVAHDRDEINRKCEGTNIIYDLAISIRVLSRP